MKFLRQLLQELAEDTVFGKTEVIKIEDYFPNKETCVYHFREILKKITSKRLLRK